MAENNEQNKVNIVTMPKTSLFDSMIETAIRENGLHLTASKGFGKSRLLFSIAQAIRNLGENSRVFIFDGSEAWLYGFSKIAVFNVNEEDISINQVKTTEDIETYNLNNWELVKLALDTEKDLLFRLKTRKPSKRGFFIRTVVNFLDAQQRAERITTANHDPTKTISYFIEEAQDAFNSRSTARTNSEEFLTVFNEARNNKESFFTASQRLNDFSKTIRTKQQYVLGRISPEDMCQALRAIEKESNVNLSKMPLRTWMYSGQQFKSPDWIQGKGKPYIINRALKMLYGTQHQTEQKPSLMQRLKNWANGSNVKQSTPEENEQAEREFSEIERESKQSEIEDSELDLYMTNPTDDNEMFPPEIDDSEDV